MPGGPDARRGAVPLPRRPARLAIIQRLAVGEARVVDLTGEVGLAQSTISAQVQRWNLPEGWVISRHPAHPALVSEADFIGAQDASAPRGPAGPAARRYLLAGLLACGRCRRRLESAWSNGKPAYRCRHGHPSAARPDPGRPKNTYVREDQILPHLTAIAILLASDGQARGSGTVQVTAAAQTAGLIDQLRASGAALTYDPDTRTIRA